MKFRAAVLGAVLLVAALGSACRHAEGPPVGTRPSSLADSADQVLYHARFAITDQGLKRADIEGDTAFFFHDNTLMVLRPMRGKFFSSNGAMDGIIQAREGIYDTRLATLQAHGDVLVTTLDGKRLNTPQAKFDQRLNQLSSDSVFTMSEPGKEAHGIGFTSDADLTSFRVLKLLSSKAGAVTLPQ